MRLSSSSSPQLQELDSSWTRTASWIIRCCSAFEELQRARGERCNTDSTCGSCKDPTGRGLPVDSVVPEALISPQPTPKIGGRTRDPTTDRARGWTTSRQRLPSRRSAQSVQASPRHFCHFSLYTQPGQGQSHAPCALASTQLHPQLLAQLLTRQCHRLCQRLRLGAHIAELRIQGCLHLLGLGCDVGGAVACLLELRRGCRACLLELRRDRRQLRCCGRRVIAACLGGGATGLRPISLSSGGTTGLHPIPLSSGGTHLASQPFARPAWQRSARSPSEQPHLTHRSESGARESRGLSSSSL